jgi:hypothetical protein
VYFGKNFTTSFLVIFTKKISKDGNNVVRKGQADNRPDFILFKLVESLHIKFDLNCNLPGLV